MKLLGRTWQYINEGNAHIVVELLETNYVLRLIKEGEKPVQEEHIKASVDFVNLVMVPLSENYLYGVSETVVIPESILPEICSELQVFRPKKRLIKSTLSQFAIKVANLSIVSPKCKSNYCVEIKPKEGFLSSSLKMHSKCYFCLKQHLKIQNKDISETSEYCPLDLFSGDRKRMKLALQNMIKNPQNNFKLFKNGTIMYNDKLGSDNIDYIFENLNIFDSANLLIDFIIEVLIKNKTMDNAIVTETEKISNKNETDSTPKLCNESNDLKPNNLLYNLLQLQKLSAMVPIDITEKTDQSYEYVTTILDHLQSMKLDLNMQKDKETFIKTANPLHLALISAVAKDCSIMISFATDYVENTPYMDVENFEHKRSRVYYKVALTDLEPKPITTLIKRKHTEINMIEVYEKYLQSLNKEVVCKYLQMKQIFIL